MNTPEVGVARIVMRVGAPILSAVGTEATLAQGLELRLLGVPAWRIPSQPWQPLSAKDAALLALLAVDGAQTRDRLGAMLWPDTSPPQAQASLRQRAHRLRKASGQNAVLLEDLVRLHPAVRHDALKADDAGARPLGPFEFDDADELARWVQAWRERWHDAVLHQLADRAEAHERQGEIALALVDAQAVVRLAPLREHAWRRLMRLHAQRGDRAAAMAAFERCEALLRDEFGTRPDAETLELRALVDQHSVAPPTRRRARLLLPAALLRPPRLIGRDAQWRAMEAAWEQGRTFVLLAAAGLGKTRLLQDFLAERSGVMWVESRAGDGPAPYALTCRWLQPLVMRQCDRLTAFERRELSRLLPELGDAPSAAGHQGVLWRAIESVLRRAVDDGLRVFAVEDVHAADTASLELLRWLAAAGNGSSADLAKTLRFALTARDGEGQSAQQEAFGQWLAASHRPVAITLPTWQRSEVEALVATLGHKQVDTVADALFRHAGGQPFFTLETLKELALREQPPEPGGALPVPGTVQALIDRRMAELSHPAHDLMRVAAIAGPRGDASLVARVLGGSALSWSDSWAELEAADILRDGHFTHDLMREAALRSIPVAVARALHAAIARELHDQGGEDAVSMAEHWESARQWPEAGRAWQKAGLAARLAGRLREQHDLLQRAAEAFAQAGDAVARFDALYAAIDGVLIRQGGQAMLDEVNRIAPWAARSVQHLLVAIGRADALLNLQRPDEALAETGPMMVAPERLGEWRPDAMCLHGQALAHVGRVDEALFVLREARALAAASCDDVRSLHVASAMANACIAAARQGEALELQREALQRAQRVGDTAEVALAQGNLATVYMSCGLPREGHAMALAALSSHMEMGSADGVHAAVALIAQGSGAMWLGCFDEASGALEKARALLGERAGGAAHAKVETTMACLLLMQGRDAAALSCLTHLLPDTPPALRLVAGLVRWRAAQRVDASAAADAERQVLDQLHQSPDLQRHPAVLLEWGAHLPAMQAVRLLDEVARLQDAQGAVGIARSLRCVQALRLGESDRSAAAGIAAALVEELPLGCHFSLHVPSMLTRLRGLCAA